MESPVFVAVEKPQAASETVSGLMPRARKAREMLRPCHFLRSQKRTISAAMASGGERAGQDRRVDMAALEALAAFQRGDGNHGRAEQHAVDGVEVALHGGENIGERSAVVLCLAAPRVVTPPP